ncbi:MAG: c-type cytochrome [Rhodomicrobium sp.]
MRVVSVAVAFQAAILAFAFSGAAHASDFGRHAYSKGRHPSKIQYCMGCHGTSGQGYRGYLPIPRLAGQTSEYFENQLAAFDESKRENIKGLRMSKVHNLNPSMRTSLASYFGELHARPVGGGSKRLAEAGKKIFEEGIPEAGVPACSACHGPNAKGDGANPRLAGQLYPYVVKELVNWNKERALKGEDTSAVMAPIAQALNKSQIEAVAAYLSHLD